MKLHPLLLALPLALAATSCDEAKVHASEALEKGSQAMQKLAQEVRDIDWSALQPEAIVAKGKEIAGDVAQRLGEIRDSESASKLVDQLTPVVDKLQKAKEILGDKMPTMSQLQEAARKLEERVAGDEGLKGAVQPLLERLEKLFQ